MKPARARKLAAHYRAIADLLEEDAAEAGAPPKPRAPVRLRAAPPPTNDASAEEAARGALRRAGVL